MYVMTWSYDWQDSGIAVPSFDMLVTELIAMFDLDPETAPRPATHDCPEWTELGELVTEQYENGKWKALCILAVDPATCEAKVIG